MSDWIDPDDAPLLTPEVLARAEYSVGGKVVRRATGTYAKAGRPPVGEEPKVQISLRLDSDLIDYFRKDGPGWQTRMNAALRKMAGL